MGYFPVRYDSRVVNYDRRGFLRLATGNIIKICNNSQIRHIGLYFFREKPIFEHFYCLICCLKYNFIQFLPTFSSVQFVRVRWRCRCSQPIFVFPVFTYDVINVDNDVDCDIYVVQKG